MFKTLGIFAVGTLIVSCAVSPSIYSLLLSCFPDLPWPYSRVFDRVIMVVGAVWLWVKRRELSLNQYRGYYDLQKPQPKLLLLGLSCSLLSTLAVLPLLVFNETFTWADHPLWFYVRKLPLILGSGLIVSVIEESFFRLILFKGLTARLPVIWAAVLSSSLYAVIHFVRPVKNYSYQLLTPFVGFEYLEVVLARLLTWELVPGYLGLFLVGMVLCQVLHRTGSLYFCIGLHMGWVVALKLVFNLTDIVGGVEAAGPLGRQYFLLGEPLAWGAIVLAALFAWILGKRFQPLEEKHA